MDHIKIYQKLPGFRAYHIYPNTINCYMKSYQVHTQYNMVYIQFVLMLHVHLCEISLVLGEYM